MKFLARFDGHCYADNCVISPDNRIYRGEHVEYMGDELMHQACAAAVRRALEIERQPPCGVCGLQHRGEC